jgi:uncharacterized protein
MSWETAKKAIDLFFNQVPAGKKDTRISFFGGEPVLAFPLMKKIIEYSYGHRTIGGYTGGKYNYVINSNGTILTDEMFEFYKKLGKKLNIRVSVDGYKEKHDFSRRTKEGQGSWSLLEKNLPRFRELKEKYKVNVYLVSMINKSTCRDIYYNYKNLHELMGMRIYSQFIHEENWNEDDYRAIKEQIMLLHDYCVQRKMPVFSNLCDTGSGQKTNSSSNKDGFSGICNAGIGSFTVNHAGDIFSCHRAYYYGMDEPFKIGNVDKGFDGTRIKLVREINNLNKRPAKCHECLPAIRNRCHLCIPSNNKAYGDFYVMPDGYCALMKEVHYELVEREKKLKQCA